MKDCVKIEFKDGLNLNYLWADKCHLEYSSINGERRFFYRGKETKIINGLTLEQPKLIKILSVSRLTKAGKSAAEKLSRRPYLRAVMNQVNIKLYCANIDNYSSLPDDAQAVWTIANTSDSWVIERSSGATLHILNNGERSVKAKSFQKALKKLFPKQVITIYRRIVTTKIETVN